MKKIISIFLALVITVTAIPIAPMPVAGSVASDTDDEEEYTYYTGVKTYDSKNLRYTDYNVCKVRKSNYL